jgi:predicted esterase
MNAREQHIRVSKRARYYSLGNSAEVSDVWIVCHGYGQLAGKFIEQFNCIAAANRLIVAPEALHRFYLDPPPAPAAQRRVGATWMTREDREADIADYIDYLDALVSEVLSESPAAHLRVLGFSQGTATMLRWAIRGVRVPQHLIIWAGEVPTDVDWNMGARKLAHSRIDVVHGSRDDLTSEATLERNLRTLSEVGLSYELHQFNGRHHLDDPTLIRLANH